MSNRPAQFVSRSEGRLGTNSLEEIGVTQPVTDTEMERPPATRPESFVRSFYRSQVGRKWIMALSGVALVGFVFFHMLGNLHLYEAPGANGVPRIDEYAEGLREIGEPIVPRTGLLWVARLGLLGAFLVHIHAGYSLWWKSRKSRPVAYEAERTWVTATFASRNMVITGTIVLLFVIYHLAHLTWGVVHEDFIPGEVQHNVVTGLDHPVVAGWYIVANLALGLHVLHGIWSMFQSLGSKSPRLASIRTGLATGITALIVLGNLSFPILVMAGVVG